MTFHASEYLFLNNEFSDVTFIVESQSIPGHKMLLASCPYFRTMLFGATNESKMSTIHLKNVSYKIFVEVLRCIYRGKVEISGWRPEEIKKLLQMAETYQLPAIASAVAEAVDVHYCIGHIFDDVVGIAIRLNCVPLMQKCADSLKSRTGDLLKHQKEFDRLPKELICHLIDTGFWHPANARLLLSIANWRKTGSTVEEKKVLLSKIDWKSLPGKYSEPLVRMFLKDNVIGLQIQDWTSGLRSYNRNILPAAVYISYNQKLLEQNSDQVFPATVVMDNKCRNEYVIIFFREQITSVEQLKFSYKGKAEISLTIYEASGKRNIIGTSNFERPYVLLQQMNYYISPEEMAGTDLDTTWQFNIPPNVQFSSAILEIHNPDFGDKALRETKLHHMAYIHLCYY